MPLVQEPDTEELVRQAAAGNDTAAGQLLDRHRGRLKRIITIRMNPRLARRLDPSDVLQDSLVEAYRRLPEFLRSQKIPFFPWLRRIALDRLLNLHRRHLDANRRSLRRELAIGLSLSDRSAEQLMQHLAASGSSPGHDLLKKELQRRVNRALKQLSVAHREIVVMRHLEQLSVREIAAVLDIPEGTVKSRHFRAVEILRELLTDEL